MHLPASPFRGKYLAGCCLAPLPEGEVAREAPVMVYGRFDKAYALHPQLLLPHERGRAALDRGACALTVLGEVSRPMELAWDGLERCRSGDVSLPLLGGCEDRWR